MPDQTLLGGVIGEDAYAAMLADPVQFVRAFDREPWDYQADILREVLERDTSGIFEKPSGVVSLPRQNGKTTLATWAGAWRFFVDPTLGDGVVLSVALDTEGARVAFGDARRLVQNSQVLSALTDDKWGMTRSEIRLKDGRRWLIRSAEAIRSRGLRVGTLLYDELGWAVSSDLFETLSAAMAAQPNPLMLAVSTVGPIQAGPLWDLFQAAERGDPGVKLIYHMENLSPLISEEFLERQRAAMPSFIYAREHENKWGTASDVFSTHEDWERAVEDGNPTRVSDEGPTFCFVDLGWVHDLTALAVAKVVGEKIDIIHLETFKGSQDKPVQLAMVQSRLEELGALYGFKQLEIESPQGMQLSQQIKIPHCKITVLTPTAKSNQQRWGGFYTALKDSSVRLPPDSDLRRELLTLTIEERAVGWKVIDVPSIHNDRSVACAGAIFLAELARSGGRFRGGPFRALTPRGVVDGEGKLVESTTSNIPKWKRSGYDQQEAFERKTVENLSDSRRARIFQVAASGSKDYELGKQFSLSVRQIRWVLETEDA
ncbi:MAG: hypothetical protein IIA89_07740 [Chloroflexi bacterium]|nr:hypothetical protein [Chloroflexota bacterium]